MTGQFGVDPEVVLDVATGVRGQVQPLRRGAEAVPDVDAGIAEPIVENAVTDLLGATMLALQAMEDVADSAEASAVNYRDADQRSSGSMDDIVGEFLRNSEALRAEPTSQEPLERRARQQQWDAASRRVEERMAPPPSAGEPS